MLKSVKPMLVGMLLVVLACGKSGDAENAAGDKKAEAGQKPEPRDPSAIVATLEARGFRVVQDRNDHGQRPSRLASVVVYQSKDSSRGGVFYVQRPTGGGTEEIVWHWYFDDAAPDSASVVEINGDGLWDVRVYMPTGRTVDALQGGSFSLVVPFDRSGVARNGASSSPADVWKCFDGDTATAWQSPAAGAFIEVPNPAGVPVTELELWVDREHAPSRIDLYAGDSRVQTLDVAPTPEKQRFLLDAAVSGAPTIRVEPAGAAGSEVRINELEIR